MVSIQGFQILTDNNNPMWLRFAWTIIMMSTSLWAGHQIWTRWSLYSQKPISLTYEYREESYITFPSITLCSSEPYGQHAIGHQFRPHNWTIIGHRHSDIDLNQVWETQGVDVYSLIKKCQWKHVDCLSPLYWSKVYTILGRCYTLSFKHQQGIKISRHNMVDPVLIMLDSTAVHTQGHSTWKALIHDDSLDVTYKVLTQSIPISTKYFNRLLFTKRLRYRIQPCPTTQEVNQCHSACMDKELLSNATCRMPFMKTSALPLCTKDEEIKRLYPIPIQHYHKPLEVQCTCQSACNTTVYDVHIDVESKTYRDFANKTAIKILPSSSRPDIMVTYERCHYNFNNLLCDIGATLGLYLGMSILTICELIEYLILCLVERPKRLHPASNVKHK